jgi:N-dimethylarginine dimethylaminohydrolase
MCAPDYFGVHYVINPWMVEGLGKSDHARAHNQWEALRQALSVHADLELVVPRPGLPDMVFTANAGLVWGKTAIASRFRTKERQGEENYFREWFSQNGFHLAPWPETISFEGAGDALFDRDQPLLWAAYGFRSDIAARPLLETIFERRVISLHLIDERFYHLDTCFCPLEGGYTMYYPGAFDAASQEAILDNIPSEKRLLISEEDALLFACNAVELNHHLYLNGASSDLQSRLKALGITPVIIPLSEFMKSGGAAKCLTLKLIES